MASRDELLAMVLDDGLRAIREEAVGLTGDDPSPVDALVRSTRAHVRCAVERPSGPLIVSNLDLLAAPIDQTAGLLHEHEELMLDEVINATIDLLLDGRRSR